MLEEPPLIVRTQDSIIPNANASVDDFRKAVSRILSSPKISEERIICLSSQYPGPEPTLAMERAAPWSPIWPCTRWGFPCLRAYAWSGGLLLHLFTLTQPAISNEISGLAVCFLWHCPSGRLTASPPACIPHWPSFVGNYRLRGIAPFGVRTFLPPEII